MAPKIHLATRLWWIRHAPIDGQSLYGQTDVLCKNVNIIAFETLASYLPSQAIVVCSPLRRSYETLRKFIAAGWSGIATILIDPAFTEQNFGSLEDLTWDASQKMELQAFWKAPFLLRPMRWGENFLDVIIRTQKAVEQLLCKYRGCNIVVLTHAGPIRAILALTLSISLQQIHSLSIDQLSVSYLENHDEM